jgi:hypothetical protein
MKKITSLSLILSSCLLAAVPNHLDFQGLAIDSIGNKVSNTNIAVKFEVINSSDVVVFTDTNESVTTSSNAIFNLKIGNTTQFSDINWSNDTYSLQISTDYNLTDGVSYTLLGSQGFSSIPYALTAKIADTATTALVAETANGVTGLDINTLVTKDSNGLIDITSFKLSSGASNGKVLVSDENGTASWQTLPIELHSINTTSDDSNYANAWGEETNASGKNSTALGYKTKSEGKQSISWGSLSNASGDNSSAWGYSIAVGEYSTSFGFDSNASATYSTVFGVDTKASGYSSLAFGNRAHASGNVALAFGYDTLSSGYASLAFGSSTIASGSKSTSWGNSTEANTTNATAFGNSTLASGENSTAIGYFTKASGTSSFSLGTSSKASGENSSAFGDGTEANVTNATVFGRYSIASGLQSIATGRNTHAKNDNSSAFGYYTFADHDNMFVVGQNNTENNVKDIGDHPALFVVGNGSSPISRADAFSVYDNGNAVLSGSLTQNSDERLKTNIEPLQNALQNILKINGVTYNWRSEYRAQEKQIGVIAQNIQEVFPELVSEDNNGYLSVNYIQLTPILIEALKEQQKVINTQQKQLNNILEALKEAGIPVKE